MGNFHHNSKNIGTTWLIDVYKLLLNIINSMVKTIGIMVSLKKYKK